MSNKAKVGICDLTCRGQLVKGLSEEGRVMVNAAGTVLASAERRMRACTHSQECSVITARCMP